MKYRMLVLAVPLALVMSLSLGCGLLGGGSGDGVDELVLLEFEESPAPAAPAGEQEAPATRHIGFNEEILVEVRYLYQHQVQLESFRRQVRDLLSLLDYSSNVEIDLEWVIEVHEVTKESEELFRQLTSFRVPASQREQYEDFYIGTLEAVQMSALGSDRVLEASYRVGPSGRTLAVMPRREREEFLTLMRESRFYLGNAEGMVERQIRDVGGVVSRIRLR